MTAAVAMARAFLGFSLIYSRTFFSYSLYCFLALLYFSFEFSHWACNSSRLGAFLTWFSSHVSLLLPNLRFLTIWFFRFFCSAFAFAFNCFAFLSTVFARDGISIPPVV